MPKQYPYIDQNYIISKTVRQFFLRKHIKNNIRNYIGNTISVGRKNRIRISTCGNLLIFILMANTRITSIFAKNNRTLNYDLNRVPIFVRNINNFVMHLRANLSLKYMSNIYLKRI